MVAPEINDRIREAHERCLDSTYAYRWRNLPLETARRSQHHKILRNGPDLNLSFHLLFRSKNFPWRALPATLLKEFPT